MKTKLKFNHMQRSKHLMPPGNEHEIMNAKPMELKGFNFEKN